MKQIIFTHGGGRFANQFFTQLNLQALEIENAGQITCVSLPFLAYEYFTQRPPHHWVAYVARFLNALPRRFLRRKANRLFYLLLHRFAKASYACNVLADPALVATRTTETSLQALAQLPGETLVLAGWPLRCWDFVEKHAAALRAAASFKPRYQQPADALIARIRQDRFEKIIGIQMRQDDYREFLAGRYFFEAETYLRFAERAAEVFYPGKMVALLVTSDTPQNNLSSLLVVYRGPGAPMGIYDYICDLAALAQCDLIIAPPSTFASTASFLGQVPYLPLRRADQVPNTQDVLQNGLFDAIKDATLSDVIA